MSMRRSVAPAQPSTDRTAFAEDVAYYLSLTPRQLPSRYLYDTLVAALFDAICALPWYDITRTERRLLQAHASEILALGGPVSTVVELGPGNGEKLAILVDAAAGIGRKLLVHLVDVSTAALAASARAL